MNIIQIAHATTSVLVSEEVTFNNPFSSFSSLPELLLTLINVLLILAVPLIVFFLIYAGFNYVMARGNPEKVVQASRSLLFGLIGAVLILGAFAIVAIVKGTVCQFSDSSEFCQSQ